MKPDWLSIKKKPGKIKPMSTRNVVKKHLKEWNYDESRDLSEEDKEKRDKAHKRFEIRRMWGDIHDDIIYEDD